VWRRKENEEQGLLAYVKVWERVKEGKEIRFQYCFTIGLQRRDAWHTEIAGASAGKGAHDAG